MNDPSTHRYYRPAAWIGIALFLVTAVLGCMRWREFSAPPAPEVPSPWRELIAELRAFEDGIGFVATKNFQSLTGEREAFPFCGRASRYILPYSYEDPVIRWLDSLSEGECHAQGAEADVYFGTVEAMGEIGTPVTPSMLKGKLDRFVYLIIHEDCHDQFDLPYGVEEALCNVIAYSAMDRFSSAAYRWYSRENRAIKSYTGMQSSQTRATIRHYTQLERLYARYHRAEVSEQFLFAERARIFASAERALAFETGTVNNIVLANSMTYSRHYPLLEKAFATLGHDLPRTVAFFRHIDRIKPTKAAVMERHGLKEAASVEYVRAYESAVVQTVTRALVEWRRTRWAGAPSGEGGTSRTLAEEALITRLPAAHR